jgi:competence protein ComEC
LLIKPRLPAVILQILQKGNTITYDAASEYLGKSDRMPIGSTIDWMILSHPHSDHAGGLYGFIQDYDVRNILDPGHDKTNDEEESDRLRTWSAYGRFFQAASAEVFGEGQMANFVWGIPDNFMLDWGAELDVDILWSSREIVDNGLNNVSIVLRLSFTDAGNDISFLFPGDAERHVEDILIKELGSGLRTTVLKAGNHGSNSSTTEAFLQQVRPQHIVITAGNQNFSGTMRPSPEVFTRIQNVSNQLNLNTQVWRTDLGDKTPTLVPVGSESGDDTILATTDGKTLSINYVVNGR